MYPAIFSAPRFLTVLFPVVAILSLLGVTGPVTAAISSDGFDVRPVGGEFLVNTVTEHSQTFPDLALDDSGHFVVVWEDSQLDGSAGGIFAQRFSPLRQALGPVFRINGTTAGRQAVPKIAMQDNGNFVVVWYSFSNQDGNGTGIYGRRFEADGTPLGDEFLVNTDIVGNQFLPAVACTDDGDFVVVWSGVDEDGFGMRGQRFASDGSFVGSEFVVNTDPADDQIFAAVDMNNTGSFVITWVNRRSGEEDDVFARRYGADGNALGDEFNVFQFADGDQENPSVAIKPDGSFFIVADSEGFDISGTEIVVRRFDTDGAPLSDEQIVNVETLFSQTNPDIALDDEGNYLIVWEGNGSGEGAQDTDGLGIHGKGFFADGSEASAEFRINSHTPQLQELPVVSMNSEGGYVVVWSSENQDGNSDGVYGKGALGSIVGDGTLASCTESALDTALANGGEIVFECGTSVARINLTTSKELLLDTLLEGDNLVELSGGDDIRLFSTNDNDFYLQNIKLFKGRANDGLGGAAVLVNGGSLIADHIVMREHTASHGGAINVTADGRAEIRNSHLKGNRAIEAGGAILSYGELILENSSLSGNLAAGGDDFSAAGIVVQAGNAQLTNVTLVRNQSAFGVGGIAVLGNADLRHVTIVDNRGSTDGGGMNLASASANISIANSLVAGNWGRDCRNTGSGSLVATGNNLDVDGTCAAISGSNFSSGNLAELNYGRLHEIDEYSSFMPLYTGSLAIDAGDQEICDMEGIVSDQRGMGRDEICDIGSYETTGVEPRFRPHIINAGQVDSGESEEIAILAPNSLNEGRPTVFVHRRYHPEEDHANFEGTQSHQIAFNHRLTPQGLVLLDDVSTSANGHAEVAMMGYRDINGAPLVQIRDLVTGENLGTIAYNRSQRIEKLLVLADGEDAGSDPEIAIVGPRGLTGRPAAEVRDSVTGALIRVVRFSPDLQIIDAVALPDQNDNDSSEIALLGRRGSSGRYLLQVRDSQTQAVLLQQAQFPDYASVALAAIPDDIDNNGYPDLAIASRSLSGPSENSRIRLIDGATRDLINVLNYGRGQVPRWITTVPDGVDFDGAPGIVMIQSSNRASSQESYGVNSETRRPDGLGVLGRSGASGGLPLAAFGANEAGFFHSPHSGLSEGEISFLLYHPVTGTITVTTRDHTGGDDSLMSEIVIP